MNQTRKIVYFSAVFSLFCIALFAGMLREVSADVYSSTNYQIIDPVITGGADRGTSNTCILRESEGEVGIGLSTSASYNLEAGFLAAQAYCGDGACNGAESCSTCSTDCGVCTPAAPAEVTGGGGGPINPSATAILNGISYPNSLVFILKDGQSVGFATTDSQGLFTSNIGSLSAGDYYFSVYSKDDTGRQSRFVIVPVETKAGQTISVSEIYIPPTLNADKTSVRKGDTITLFGHAIAGSVIRIQIEHGEEEIIVGTISDQNGKYSHTFDTTTYDLGDYTARVSATQPSGLPTDASNNIEFTVGTQNALAETARTKLQGDLNDDGKVNLIDFSILIYWISNDAFPGTVDLDNSGAIDLIDVSIMLFYWTG